MWQTKFGKCIFVSPSGYKVFQNFFYRWLTLGSDALQTVINRRQPNKPILHYLPALTLTARQFPSRMCLLGLGGAGIPLMMNKYNNPKIQIDVVDNSQEIIEIAQKYFILKPIKNLKIIHQNASDFVLDTKVNKYPHLIIDLYDANHFPKECFNEQFFYACKEKLTVGGYLSINLANIKEQWPIFQIIKKYFKYTLVIPIKKCANLVIIASNDGAKDTLDTFLNTMRDNNEIKRVVWVEKWGYVADY